MKFGKQLKESLQSYLNSSGGKQESCLPNPSESRDCPNFSYNSFTLLFLLLIKFFQNLFPLPKKNVLTVLLACPRLAYCVKEERGCRFVLKSYRRQKQETRESRAGTTQKRTF